jgi:23S rRNA pseudouridine2605 synthase
MRLQKFLSDAGVASRRDAEQMILDGRVAVNGRPVTRLPAFVDPQQDRVTVDGDPCRAQPPEYYMVHKPAGVVCTSRDPAGRPRALDLAPPTRARLFVVGRLDASSTGLLLLTNDGELAQRITHARYGVPKTYRAEVAGMADAELIAKLRKGVFLEEGKALATEVDVVHRAPDLSVLHITLRGGRDRLVRKMLARLGHRVLRLKRLQIGPLSVKGLPLGAARPLSRQEVAALRRGVTDAARGAARRRRPPRERPPRAPNRGAAAPPARSAAPQATGRRRRVIS